MNPSTYAACLTPPGTGAIATIAVRGPEALEIVRQLFRPASTTRGSSAETSGPSSARQVSDTKFTLGKFGDEVADEVVLRVQRREPVPWIELHCHGGREVVRLILETLQRHGVQTCTWPQLERLTTQTPLRTEAAIQLTQARTLRTAAILLDQQHGALEHALNVILTALDSGDETTIERLLATLARYVPLGRHLTVPWSVVVAGAPNVGKSSLVNALAGFPRSIVSSLPGTTRDVVTVGIALEGWPIELIDTAGLRAQAEMLEEQGIRLAADAVRRADLCLWVLDGTAAPPNPIAAIPTSAGPGLEKTLLVINKVDLPAAWDFTLFPEAIRISARTGEGLSDLGQAIASRLVPEPPPAGAAVPFTTLLGEYVLQARHYWYNGHHEQLRRLVREMCQFPAGRGSSNGPVTTEE